MTDNQKKKTNKKLQTLTSFMEVLKIYGMASALVYLVGWGAIVAQVEWFKTMDSHIGFLPDFLCAIAGAGEAQGDASILGYSLSIVVNVFLVIICCYSIEYLDKLQKKQELEETRKELARLAELVVKTEKKKAPLPISTFYGLFEYVFHGESDEDLDDLKSKYTSLMAEKLKYKYKDFGIEVELKDGEIKFMCSNFSRFDILIEDVYNYHNTLSELNRTNAELCLKFCLYANMGCGASKAFSMLREISNLNYLNKIVVNNDIAYNYEQSGYKRFGFASLGEVKFINAVKGKNQDLDIELFRLFNRSVSQRNNP